MIQKYIVPTDLYIHSQIDSNAYLQMQANQTITMDTSILTKSTVMISAGNEIQLLPGFEVAAGADFVASIGACTGSSLKINMPIFTRSNEIFKPANDFDEIISLTVSPNPFSYQTSIQYYLEKSTKVNLKIYDLNGQLINTLASNEWQEQGEYSYNFQAPKSVGIVYFLVLQTAKNVISRKLILLD